MIKWLGWDIEVADWPEDNIIKNYDLGITCAGVAYDYKGDTTYKTWHTHPKLTRSQAVQMVTDLETAVDRGFTIVTVNGAAFDFRVLAEVSGLKERCKTLALDHVDLLAIVYAHKCHMLGLNAMTLGAKVATKLKNVTLKDGSTITDMDGSKAPEMWREGHLDAVLAYLKQDCKATLQVAQVANRDSKIAWISQKGRANSCKFKLPLAEMTVGWCLKNYKATPPSWLTNYVPLPEFIDWL